MITKDQIEKLKTKTKDPKKVVEINTIIELGFNILVGREKIDSLDDEVFSTLFNKPDGTFTAQNIKDFTSEILITLVEKMVDEALK